MEGRLISLTLGAEPTLDFAEQCRDFRVRLSTKSCNRARVSVQNLRFLSITLRDSARACQDLIVCASANNEG